MINQVELRLRERTRGFHLITDEVLQHLPTLPDTGLLSLFIKHTSAGLTINENCDHSVRADFEMSFNDLIPEINPKFTHTAEGPDDMPAHIKSSLVGHSLLIPISGGQLNMGTWQGLYLCEFRSQGGHRTIVASIYS